MKRLFFALWPAPEIRGKIAGLNRGLKIGRARKTKPDNIHVTLVFLGNVTPEQQQAMVDGAGAIKAEAFDLLFDRMTLWRRPGILSLTSSEQPQPLFALVNELNKIAIGCDIDVDKRAYKAHVTLARRANIKPEIELQPIPWWADSFALVESVGTESGSVYRVLQSWPLQRGA